MIEDKIYLFEKHKKSILAFIGTKTVFKSIILNFIGINTVDSSYNNIGRFL
jgi:hypothetical protein